MKIYYGIIDHLSDVTQNCFSTLLDNNIIMPSDILDCIPINSQFGSNITYDPSYAKWIKIKNGIYSSMTITLTDQNFNTIYARDSNLIITLMIRQRSNME